MNNTTERVVDRAIVEYNKYRVPEVKAILIDFNENGLRISFEGSYCLTCGFYDYFDDFKITLEDLGLKTDITDIEEKDESVTVDFKIFN
jgi:hypothetical protein